MLGRREFLEATVVALAGLEVAEANPDRMPRQGSADPVFGPLRQVPAGPLDVGYFDVGPPAGSPVLLLHGFPYDVHSFVDVVPRLSEAGCRVLVPYLRGHGPTAFRHRTTARSGQQAALARDVTHLMDALGLDRAVLAGYDWGGRAACVVAALWPERCTGLVSVNGYLIQDIANASRPLLPSVEAGLWYQFYFLTERGRQGLTDHRRELARVLWTHNSPTRVFSEGEFSQVAAAFDNPDYVDVVIHSYRHRLGFAAGAAEYQDIESRLADRPRISVPTITMDGAADGVVQATDGTSAAHLFTGPRRHVVVPGAGHDLPREAPGVFSDAVLAATRGRV